MLSYLQGAYAYRGAGEDKVSCLEHEELAHVAHQFVHPEEHVHGMSALYCVSVYVEMEMYVLHVRKALHGYEVAQHGRSVKSLAEFPWQPLLAESLLHVACRDVYPYGDSVVVSVSKTGCDVLAQLVDAYH